MSNMVFVRIPMSSGSHRIDVAFETASLSCRNQADTNHVVDVTKSSVSNSASEDGVPMRIP